MRNEIAKSKILLSFEGEELEHDTEGAKQAKWLWIREWLGEIILGEISMKKCSFNLSNILLPKLGQWENTELQIKRLLHFLMKTYQGWQAWLFIWVCFAFHYDQVLICSPPKQYKL